MRKYEELKIEIKSSVDVLTSSGNESDLIPFGIFETEGMNSDW